MSNNTPDSLPDQNQASAEQSHLARRLAAVAAIAAVAVGVVVHKEHSDSATETHSHIDRDTSPTSPATIETGKPTLKTPLEPKPTAPETGAANSLKIIENLPGYGLKVTAEERAMMRDSTVKVAVADKNVADADYGEWCTGFKTSIGGKTYVMSALHCFGDNLYESGADDGHKAKNVTKDLPKKVGIWAIGANGLEDARYTAPVSSVSGSVYPDMALLKVDTTDPGSAMFNKVPAVSLENHLNNTAEAGAEVEAFSVPDVTGGKLAESKGAVFLGMAVNPTDPSEMLYMVGVSPKSPAEDIFSKGSSGVPALIAGGTITGPMSIFYSKEYSSAQYAKESKDISKELGGLDISRFSTICGFGVATAANVHALAQVN